MSKKEIITTERANDYHACLKDNKGVWGCGNNIYEAIGQMIVAHPEEFNIEIK